jgi:hypothetical protein
MNVVDRAGRAGAAVRLAAQRELDVMAALDQLEKQASGTGRRALITVGLGVAAAVAAGFGVVAVVGDNSSTGEPASPQPSVVDSPDFAPPNLVQPVPGTPGGGLLIPISVTAIPTGMQVESDANIISIWGEDPAVPGGGAFFINVTDGRVTFTYAQNPTIFNDVDDVVAWLTTHPQLTVTGQSEVTVDGRPAVRLEITTKNPTGEAPPSRQSVVPFTYSQGTEGSIYPYRADDRTSMVVLPYYNKLLMIERRDAPEEQFQELLAGLRLG